MDELSAALQRYATEPAVALYAHPLGGSCRRGDEELIALFDTLGGAKSFVEACRAEKPLKVEEGWLRGFKKGTVLYHFIGWGDDLIYKMACPWLDYSGVPRNLST